jgi:hypothetical protein
MRVLLIAITMLFVGCATTKQPTPMEAPADLTAWKARWAKIDNPPFIRTYLFMDRQGNRKAYIIKGPHRRIPLMSGVIVMRDIDNPQALKNAKYQYLQDQWEQVVRKRISEQMENYYYWQQAAERIAYDREQEQVNIRYKLLGGRY